MRYQSAYCLLTIFYKLKCWFDGGRSAYLTRGSDKASLPRGTNKTRVSGARASRPENHEKMGKRPTKRPRADKNKKAARHAQAGRRTAQNDEDPKAEDVRGKPSMQPSLKKAKAQPFSLNPVLSAPFVEIEDPRLRSRLIYANPVCILTSVVPESIREKNPEIKWRRNAMILSWLTPINNEGGFVCSMHKRRFTAECITANRRFVLSVPVKGMENLVLAIGADTGKKTNKFQTIAGLRAVEAGKASPLNVMQRRRTF